MKRLTVQKVTTVVRKTGIGTSSSHASRIRGMSHFSYGTAVKTNGEVRYICARCSHGGGYHHDWCSRRHVRWHRRTIADGTFTVTLDKGFGGFTQDRDSIYGAQIARDTATLEAAFDAAGFAWSKVNGSADVTWVITGYAEEAA